MPASFLLQPTFWRLSSQRGLFCLRGWFSCSRSLFCLRDLFCRDLCFPATRVVFWVRFSTWRHPTPCWNFSVLTVGIFLFQSFLWLGRRHVVFPVYVVFPAGNATFPVFGLSFGLLAIWHVLLLAFWPFWHALHLAFLRLSGLALGSPVLWRLDMTSLCQHFFRLSGLLQAFWPASGFLAYFRLSGLLQAF